MRMSGSIAKSTDVMKAMQGLIRIPEIQGAMMDLSREMSKVNRETSQPSVLVCHALFKYSFGLSVLHCNCCRHTVKLVSWNLLFE